MIRIALGLILGLGGVGVIESSITMNALMMGILIALLGGLSIMSKVVE